MPRAKSEERIKAEQMYKENKGSMKLVEIAQRLGVTPSKVRKWKSVDGWDKQESSEQTSKNKQGERSTCDKGNAPLKNAPQTKKKKGAPKGNKNAEGNPGGGAPLRNKNTEKHGIYAKPFDDLLEGKDKEVYESVSSDEEEQLVEEIALLTVRERWLIQKIQSLGRRGEDTHGLIVGTVNRNERRREFDGNEQERSEAKALYNERQQAKIDSGGKLPGRDINISTTTVENSDLILKAHNELTRVQSQKTRCIEALNKIRQSKNGTKGNTLADDWIIALTEGAGQIE